MGTAGESRCSAPKPARAPTPVETAARNSPITARMSPSLSLETPGMKEPHALHRSRSPSLSRAASRSADRVLRCPLQLANQLALDLLRALPGRVLIVP